jgi:Mrp family chromosome partitioning ATPase
MSLLEFRSPVATLTDVMAKRSPIASAAGSIGTSCISFLPFGSDNKLLPVLANPGFASLIEQIRDTYDLVIVDAPSIFDSSEVRLLVSKADKILFAVRWGTTPRETAVSAIQLIQAADQYDPNDPNKIVSVLTDVDLRQHARYRFADQGDFLSKPKS